MSVISERPRVEDIREPDLYERGGPHGFFRDLAASTGAPIPHVNSITAADRLERHVRYEMDRLGDIEKRSQAAIREHGLIAERTESRALSTVTGVGGEFVPPKWLTELWADAALAACPLRGLVTSVDLPPGTLSLVVPRIDSTAGVVPEQTENTNAPDDYSATDEITTPVRTFLGDALLSQAVYERGGALADDILAQAFADAYGGALASQMMAGTGSNGQLLGLLNVSTSATNGVPGALLTTYTAASPTTVGVLQSVAQCAGKISDTRLRSPSVILMRGSRWFATAGSPDGSGNETVQRPGVGLTPANADTGPYGPIASLPVYHDNSIPNTLGGSSNQDAIVLVRARDLVLLEDPTPRFTAYLGGMTAGQLSVVLQWNCYTAFIPNRFPSAIGTVQGTGLVVPSGF